MANVKTMPYEILLRFNCEIGEVAGHLRGCHRVMATYLVDDAGSITGKVTAHDSAADFPPDELAKYLGEQFASFSSQLEMARMEKTSVEDQLSSTTQQAHETKNQLKAVSEALNDAQIAHESMVAELKAAHLAEIEKLTTNQTASNLAPVE